MLVVILVTRFLPEGLVVCGRLGLTNEGTKLVVPMLATYEPVATASKARGSRTCGLCSIKLPQKIVICERWDWMEPVERRVERVCAVAWRFSDCNRYYAVQHTVVDRAETFPVEFMIRYV